MTVCIPAKALSGDTLFAQFLTQVGATVGFGVFLENLFDLGLMIVVVAERVVHLGQAELRQDVFDGDDDIIAIRPQPA